MSLRVLSATFVSFVVSFCLFGQQPTLDERPLPQMVQFAGASTATVAAGKPANIELRFRIDRDKHINSNTPHSQLLIPTKLHLASPNDVGVGRISYPAGEDRSFPFAPEEKLSVYSGEFPVRAQLSAARGALPGKYRLHGELQYQACNDRACFPPMKLPVEFDVRVTKSALRDGPQRRNPPQSRDIHPPR
jgi:hypothetical protein